MKTGAIQKINKMGKVGGIFMLIAKIFIIIALVVCSIAAIVFAVMPKDFITINLDGAALVDVNWGTAKEAAEHITFGSNVDKDFEKEGVSGSLDFNGMEYHVDQIEKNDNGMSVKATVKNYTFSLHDLVWVMLISIVKLAMVLVSLFFIGALCKAIKNCNSPFEESVIRKMRNLALSLIPWVFLAGDSNTVMQFIMTGKFNMDTVIDFGMAFVILLIFGLVSIFKYGAVLQQESDETL